MAVNQAETQARGIGEIVDYGPPQEFTEDSKVGGVYPRLPRHRMSGIDVHLTERRMRAVLRWLKIGMDDYLAWSGNQSPREFIAANPDWTARAFEVLCLENLGVIKNLPTAPQNRTKVIA